MSTACWSLDKVPKSDAAGCDDCFAGLVLDASEDSLEPDACLVGRRPQAGVLPFNAGFSPFDCQLLPFDFFLFMGLGLSCQAGASTRAEQGLGTTRKTTIMRRLKQLDRREALPVNRIHGSGQVFSARYR